ncbi:MAG: hypothetical protein CSA62_11570 [Planctomycetota bacterium]|nr:MAG: hypothetical protein CSA62_11570 [Planctomycetota bacterium]
MLARSALLVFSSLAAPSLALAQAEGLAAKYQGGSVSMHEFCIELARRHRGKALGKDALQYLLQKRLVEIESQRRHIKLAPGQLEERIAMVRSELKRRQMSLDAYLQPMGMNFKQFRTATRISLLADELVLHDLGLPKGSRVQNKDLALWVQEMRKRHKVISDAAKLEADVALQIGEERIGLGRLGQIMLRKLSAKDRRNIIEQMVAYRLLSAQARKQGLRLTQERLKRELERRRAEVAQNPGYRRLGVDYNDLLRAQGRSVHDVVQGEVFRAQVYMQMLAEKLFPKERLDQELDEHQDEWLGLFGEQREIYRLVIQGSKTPPARSLDEAKALIEKLASEIHSKKDFVRLAKRFSEEAGTRERGGRIGFHPRRSPQVPEEFRALAFSLQLGTVSKPFRVASGWAIAMVTDLKPAPPEKALRRHIRRMLMKNQVRSWLKESNTEILLPGV